MRGENRKRLHVIRSEIIQLRAFQVHHAHDSVFAEHRHRQLRPRFGIDPQIARVERHIRHHHRALQRRRRAHNPFMRRHREFLLHALAEFHRDPMTKGVAGLVVQQNAEDLIVDQPLGQLGRAPQHFFHGQRGIRFAAHLVQKQQSFSLIPFMLEELRVLDGRADTRSHQHQNVLLIAREIVRLLAFDIQHANHAPAHHQRNRQF